MCVCCTPGLTLLGSSESRVRGHNRPTHLRCSRRFRLLHSSRTTQLSKPRTCRQICSSSLAPVGTAQCAGEVQPCWLRFLRNPCAPALRVVHSYGLPFVSFETSGLLTHVPAIQVHARDGTPCMGKEVRIETRLFPEVPPPESSPCVHTCVLTQTSAAMCVN